MTPYTSKQNGTPKRIRGIILDIARLIRIKANLLKHLQDKSYKMLRRRRIICERQINKHQICRIDSYIQLSWRLKRITREFDRNAVTAKSIQGQSQRINYLLSDIKQGKESYASSVARVAGSPVTIILFRNLVTPTTIYKIIKLI